MADQTYKIKIDTQGTEKISEGLDKAAASSKTLKQQLREMTNELQGLEPGTQRFNDLSIAAGQLRDQIADTNAVINATAGSVGENLGNALSGVAGIGIGAFQGIASAQALFGSESEELQKTLVKLQALAGLSEAVKSLGGLKDTMTNVKAAFTAATAGSQLFNTATVAQAVSTGTATVAQRIMNAVMNANPIFLIITGITALVGAFALFSSSAEDAAEKQKRLNEEQKRHDEQIERSLTVLQKQRELKAGGSVDIENEIKLLKAKGANDKEIYEAERKQIQNTLNELSYSLGFRGKLTQEEYKQKKQLQGDLKALDAQFETDQREKAEAAAEKAAADRKSRNDKWLADKKSVMEKIRAYDLEYQDSLLSDEAREIELSKRKYEELVTQANKFGLDITRITEDFRGEQASIIKKYDDKEAADKAEKDAKDAADAQAKLEKDAANARMVVDLQIQHMKEGVDKQIAARNQQYLDEKAILDKTLSDKLISQEQYDTMLLSAQQKSNDDIKTINDEARQAELEAEQTLRDQKLQGVSNILSTVSSLTEAFAGKSEKSQKKAFEIQKGIQIAQATIDTYKAATGAFSAMASIPTVGPILGAAAAAAAVAAGIANIKKIASTQFNSKTTPSGGAPAPNVTTPTQSAPVPPSLTVNGQANAGSEGQGNQLYGQRQQVIKAVVLESDITNTQNTLSNYQTMSEIG